ncbi:unnamed protein product [Linum tenue]|uniref:Uncharacterized protein n=1 Tax=Linum tenue TaxID=586396 RepID=A0AAV0RRQ9_9ROSI|nr:unnamed protein product [Linum tenue]
MAILQIRSGLPTPTFRLSGPRAAFKPPLLLHLPAQHPSLLLAGGGRRKKTERGWTVVRRAGPSTSSYIFALALPLSLLVFTVFTSIRIADKLDSDYLEELIEVSGWVVLSGQLELNQAIMEAQGIEYEEDNEDEDVDGADIATGQEELQLPVPAFGGSSRTRTRNRPKREV